MDIDYAVLLNNDAVSDSPWLEKPLEASEEYLESGFAASEMLFCDNRDIREGAE